MSKALQRALAKYEVVIGLEVHTHLDCQSKLFSPAPVRYGEEPNHSVHEIDLALPGVLPVMNERVVELAVRLGLALEAKIDRRSVFARKNYFYPDLPKGYQISQYDQPIVYDGRLAIEVEEDGELRKKVVGVTRAHLEEDAGKSIHDPAVTGSDATHVDLNRAGVPLLEIVSEPDLRSAAEAVAYLRELRAILRYTGVSNADMERGQLRCDANVSLRPRGSDQLGTRTETKNLNSFSSVQAAIEAEVVRQAALLDAGEAVVQATMGFDPAKKRTHVQRLKENADDYRYFDDPDLVPVSVDEALMERVRGEIPELPAKRRGRFQEALGLAPGDAATLTATRELADFFEGVVEALGGGAEAAGRAGKWVLRDLLAALKEREQEIQETALEPAALARLIGLVESGGTTARSAQEVFGVLIESGGDPEAIVRERGLEAQGDTDELSAFVDAVMSEFPDEVERFRGGDDKVLNFLMGQVMKRTQGKASPGPVRELLARKIRG